MRNLLFFSMLIFSAATEALDGSLILRQIDANMWPSSYEMYRKLVNLQRDGSKRAYVMYTLKKGRNKVINLFLEPAEEKGRVILRVGENMWLRIPGVEQSIRISSLHSVVGGILNNWDLMFSDFSSEYAVGKAKQEGELYALELRAKNTWAVYDSLRVWAGVEDQLLRKIEAYTQSNMLIKTITFSDVKDFGNGIRRPARMETVSPLWPGVKAIMLFGEIRMRELPDEVFSAASMSKIDDFRR
jgi:outer membrane lipoprotein-sorting protein